LNYLEKIPADLQGKLAMARGRLHFIVLLVLLAHMGSDSLIRIH
jgi:hypothetical protein